MRTQKVRIVAVDKRYMKEPYPFIPIYNERIGTYVTGQHVDPNDPSTKDNLTKEDMEHPEKISIKKKKRFPYIILPEVRLPLLHLRSFDLTVDETGNYVNQKDATEFNFFKQHTDIIAPSRDQFKVGAHYFYIENLEAEAAARLNKGKMRFEAEKLIREKGSFSKFKDIALVLNHRVKDFRVNVNASETILEDKILQACSEYPADVIKCFGEESKMDIFILRAEYQGLITRKGNAFFDGSQYLGDSLDDVKKFIKTEDGSRYERRWAGQLAGAEFEPKEVTAGKERELRFNTLIDKCSRFILTGYYEDALAFYQEAYSIDPENPILQTLREKIDAGMAGDKVPSDKKIKSSDNSDLLDGQSDTKLRDEIMEKYKNKERSSLVTSCHISGIGKDVYGNMSDDEIRELLVSKEMEDKG